MGWAHGWLLHVLHCPAWRQRATTTWDGLGPYRFAKMDLGKQQNTSRGTGPKGAGGDISLLAKRRGTNLVQLGRRLACETAAKWAGAGWAQLGAAGFGGKGRDASVEAFLGGTWPRPMDMWCLHRVLAAHGSQRRTRVQNPPSPPTNQGPRLDVWKTQTNNVMGRSDGASNVDWSGVLTACLFSRHHWS
jgi:hypothetical protein